VNPLRWLFPSLQGYRGDWLRGDLVAGLTVWAVLIPEALAYASIAGVCRWSDCMPPLAP
jgi:sulfate permease, SulP family